MIKKSVIFQGVISIIILTSLLGCGSKKHFQPPLVSGEMLFDGKLSSNIQSSSREGAVLQDRTLVSFEDGVTPLVLEKDYKYLSQDNGRYLLQKLCQEILIVGIDDKVIQTIPYDECILSANLKGDKLAMVLRDNTLVYYDIQKSQEIFSQKYPSVIAINAYLASPKITSDYVIYPDLEGKVLVYSIAQNKIVKDILISSDKFFNNVIYLCMQEEYLLAATAKRVSVVIGQKSFKYDVDLRDLIFHHNKIYVLSIEGEILELDHTLKLLRKVRLPFAVLSGVVINNNKLYTLEKGGYLVELDLSDFIPKIYKNKLKKHKSVFYNRDTIFYDKVYKRFE